MKLSNHPSNCRRSQNGSAVILLLAMLGIMMIFAAANTVAIRTLDRELKLLEKKQVQRLQSTVPKHSQISETQKAHAT